MTKTVIFLLLFFTTVSLANHADTSWMSIFVNDRKTGYVVLSRKEQNDTVITVSKSVTKIQRGSVANTIKSVEITTVFEDLNGKPLSFNHSSVNNNLKRTIRGVFSDSGYITVTENSSSGKKLFKLNWPRDALLFEGIRLAHESKPPVAGQTHTFTTLDYSTLMFETITRTVNGKEAVRIESQTDSLFVIENDCKIGNSSIKMTSYVTDAWKEKKLVLFQGGLQMVMVECSAGSIEKDIQSFDVMTESAIAAPVKAENPCNSLLSVYKLRLPTSVELPSDDEQTVISSTEGVVSVRVKKLNLNPQLSYPLTNTPPEMKEYLEPTRIIESTDSIIVKLAKKATRRAKTAAKAIQKISRTVRWYVTPAFDVQFATAAEVARGRRGDCTEYAVLTSALCRASGIPSRIVNGITYLPVTNSFYFHAWTQVFIDGKWISVDPAMRNFEPGHIAISFSKDGQPSFETLKAIGNIEIVSVQPEYKLKTVSP